MSEDNDNTDVGSSSEPGILWSRPYVSRQVNDPRFVTLEGGGHARCHVRIVDAFTGDTYSDQQRMGDEGHFLLRSYAFLPGEQRFFVWLWNGTDDWWMASRLVFVDPVPLGEESNPSIKQLDNDDLSEVSLPFSDNAQLSKEPWAVKGNRAPNFNWPQGQRVNGLQYFELTAEPGWNINVVDAYTWETLCAPTKVNGNGKAGLTLIKPLLNGIHDIVAQVWINGDWFMPSNLLRVVVLSRPVILTRTVHSLAEPITGNNGVPGATIQLCTSGGGVYFGSGIVRADGSWSVIAQNLWAGSILITCNQAFKSRKYVGETYSEWAEIVNLEVIIAPKITYPRGNDRIYRGMIRVEGTGGEPDTEVRIAKGGGGIDFGKTAPSDSLGRWSKEIDLRGINLGAFELAARYETGIHWDAVTFELIGIVIDQPANGVTVDPDAGVSGYGGEPNSIIEVVADLNHTFKVGEGRVSQDGRWTMTTRVNPVPPGPFTIVAKTVNGQPNSISGPRSFKVRPPALINVGVESPSDTTVTFSGAGHTGATVQFTLVSGPGGTAPPSVVVKPDGQWETTATGWTMGVYTLRVIQKVSDNANGWVESHPYTFTLDRKLENPSNVKYTLDYQPTFSGAGHTGATIRIANPGGTSNAAPDALVANGQWSSKASDIWGPTLNREVHIRQYLNGQESPSWLVLSVSIPPLAPEISPVDVEGFFAVVSGTCWPNAVVELTFSDSDTTFPAQVTQANWTFQRDTPFEPDINHTVTVTQTAAGQKSPAASETFLIEALIPQPVITEPVPSAEVDRDITVRGGGGLKGATMQLRDARFGGALGEPKELAVDGQWSINLTALEFREYTIDAQQTLDGRESLRSEMRTFEVVVVPPVITVPEADQNLPRTSMLEGLATPGATVDVWQEGVPEPLLNNVAVGTDGRWYAEVTLPVGRKTIWARQTVEGLQSKDSPRLTYNVVPAAPSIETPATDEHIGRQTVVSGFGVPGDTVTVKLVSPALTVLGQSPVLDDRTWSVSVEFDQPGGRYGVVAVASSDGFDSADSAARPVVLVTYLPTIELPAAGSWVSHPIGFKGQGAQGVGEVVSWFNPDQKWAVNIPVAGGWQGMAMQQLPLGGQWCRFKQTITDSAQVASDWVESERFEVVPATSSGSEHKSPDERS